MSYAPQNQEEANHLFLIEYFELNVLNEYPLWVLFKRIWATVFIVFADLACLGRYIMYHHVNNFYQLKRLSGHIENIINWDEKIEVNFC